jgi:hypothetical protein
MNLINFTKVEALKEMGVGLGNFFFFLVVWEFELRISHESFDQKKELGSWLKW